MRYRPRNRTDRGFYRAQKPYTFIYYQWVVLLHGGKESGEGLGCLSGDVRTSQNLLS